MVVRLTDEALRYIAAFEAVTGVTATDCLPDDEVITFLVPPDDMADAIGPDGRTVAALEDRIGRDVTLIEDADDPEPFVANALAPAAVYDVAIEERDDVDVDVAVVVVDEDDMGVAIGAEGHRIERAKRLTRRHFDLADIELTTSGGERRV